MYCQEGQKHLIVNADDFGLDSEINCGIIEAHKFGIVTNTSLVTCGRAFEEAIQLAKVYKDLGVGIHLTVNEERPILSRDKIRTLLDEDKGSFLNYPTFIRRFLSGRIVLNQMYSEFESQIEKFIATGLNPTHLDSHKHIHLIPKILEIVLELAKKFDIPRIRLSRIPIIRNLRSKRYLRMIEVLGLSVLANIQLKKIKRYNINTPDYCYGLIDSGYLDENRLTDILNRLPTGTNELICHPGFVTDDLLNRYRWNYNWLTELKALTNSNVKTLVKNLNIQLIRYDEI